MSQRYLQEIYNEKPGSIIVITENAGPGSHVVYAPLPETFGFTVGSDFSAPFDVGVSSGLVQKGLAIGNISQKIGLRMKKMYANPEPTEISLDLEFVAYYSAAHEVVIPIIRLAAMSLGRTITDLNERAEEAIRRVANMAGSIGSSITNITDGHLDEETDTGSIIKRVSDLIGLIEGPNTQTVSFGELYTIPNCYVTSISPQFSNVLDQNGYPLSATCSITITLEQYPIADEVIEWFDENSVKVNRGSGGRFNAMPSGTTLGGILDGS